jgi:hypothetical protein
MSNRDAFNGTRLNSAEEYVKNYDLGKSSKKVSFYRVYDKTFGRYVYFVGRKSVTKYPIIDIIAIHDRGNWYRKQMSKGVFLNMSVDPRKITVKKAGPIVEKKMAHSLWKQNWMKHI